MIDDTIKRFREVWSSTMAPNQNLCEQFLLQEKEMWKKEMMEKIENEKVDIILTTEDIKKIFDNISFSDVAELYNKKKLSYA